MPSPRDILYGPWRAVAVLGVTQVVAWGTIFYSPVLTVPLIAAERGWSLAFAMAGFSLGLLVAGLIAPTVGRSIDHRGGHVVMTIGSVTSALGLLGLVHASHPVAYLTVWMLLGAGLAASLYDAAFATLGRLYGADARPAITALTLWGGFSSTLCWPLSAFLLLQALPGDAISPDGRLLLALWLVAVAKFCDVGALPVNGMTVRDFLTIANTLFDAPYLSTNPRHQGLLLHSVYHRPNGWDYIPAGQKVPCGESSMWGDYHLRELALYVQRIANNDPYYTFFS